MKTTKCRTIKCVKGSDYLICTSQKPSLFESCFKSVRHKVQLYLNHVLNMYATKFNFVCTCLKLKWNTATIWILARTFLKLKWVHISHHSHFTLKFQMDDSDDSWWQFRGVHSHSPPHHSNLFKSLAKKHSLFSRSCKPRFVSNEKAVSVFCFFFGPNRSSLVVSSSGKYILK